MSMVIAPNAKDIGKIFLDDDWSVFSSLPGEYQTPSEFDFNCKQTVQTSVPGTIAKALNLIQPECWTPSKEYDAFDWWYQKDFQLDKSCNHQLLTLEGLATLAIVWLNGHQIVTSDNMFHLHEVDVSAHLIEGTNTLTILFKSLALELNKKHPRPKWKTKLVSQQSLRWFRTTLLGRIPGWTPPVSPVGPWKPIFLAENSKPRNININTSAIGRTGLVRFSCDIIPRTKIESANLNINGVDYALSINKREKIYELSGEIELSDVQLWWPHTHGEPKLYQIDLIIKTQSKNNTHKLQDIGFKTIKVNQANDTFQIKVNDEVIFCRGACWTTNDIISLVGCTDELLRTLTLMKEAGTNLIRIGGTMVYEQDHFYNICDQLGIMVWQDFMFANMDYPFQDKTFLSSVEKEIRQQIQRLSKFTCVSIYCGNSEIQQQIAMLGFDKDEGKIPFFEDALSSLCQHGHPSTPYIPSSPMGGELPFRSNQGLSHYYGVGAYLRPISEVRRHNVQFTTECLGFANVPIAKTRNTVLNGQHPMSHNPLWKQRTPRDSGTGWDFEDVRDYYLKSLFQLDPVKLRSFDPERYIELSEIVTGEIMSQTFSEWRSVHSNNNGGLVWFMKDFWPGAGWGIIDSFGRPKAAYYFLKRAWQPLSIHMTNESINGVDLHINNETNKCSISTLEVTLYDKGSRILATKLIEIEVPKKSRQRFSVESILEHFCDAGYAYRFGPSHHYIISARLSSEHEVHAESILFPNGISSERFDANLTAKVLAQETGSKSTYSRQILLESNKFLHGVNLKIRGFQVSDNYFHMLPNVAKIVDIFPDSNTELSPKGSVSALNLDNEVRIIT